jgi:hypothetical protein
MKKVLLFVVSGLFLLALAANAQTAAPTLTETLQKISGNAASGFVAPITNGFGADFNGGWFHKAPSSKMFGFDLEFGLVVMGTPWKDADKTFDASGSFRFDQTQATSIATTAVNQDASIPSAQKSAFITSMAQAIANQDFIVRIYGPTVTGNAFKNNTTTPNDQVKVDVSSSGVSVTSNGVNRVIPIPTQTTALGIGGVDGIQSVSMMPLASPQVSIGTLFGTQATFRYMPKYDLKDVGKFSYFGFGIQHNPGIWFPNPLPIDVCVSFFTQTMKFEPIIEAKGTGFGINVSKRFGPGALNITPYAGYMIESSKLTFSYTPTATVAGQTMPPVSFELDGANKSRLTLGISLKILFLNINADYNIAKYNSFTGGLMFII